MPYYKCEKCGAKFCGWGCGEICSQCMGLLKKVSQEEFYYPTGEDYCKVIRKAEQSVDRMQNHN